MEKFIGTLLATLVGGGITIAVNYFSGLKNHRFTVTLEVRKSLIDLHSKLGVVHNEIMDNFYEYSKLEIKDAIILYRPVYMEVMELYKTFLLHYGSCKAYEIQSAIYSYGFQLANSNEAALIQYDDFLIYYEALKDCVGIMINEVRYSLIKINNFEKIRKQDKINKEKEYTKYASRIEKSLNNNFKKLIEDNYDNRLKLDNNIQLEKQLKVFLNRIEPFKIEAKIK